MRISVNQLRALILIVNLVLAGSLVYKALGAYKVTDALFGSDAPSESHPQAVRLEKFRYVEEEFRARMNPTSAVVSAATNLQPQKPAPLELKKPELEVSDVEEGTDEPTIADLPEGPLAEDWEYVHYILRHDDPTKTLAKVRRKSDDKVAPRRSSTFSRASSSSRSRTSSAARRSLQKTTSKYRRKKKADSVSFLVSDREIENEEFEVHFWVHSADREKLVYWMPGKPKKFYALPYKHEGSYLAQGPMRRELRPEEDEDEDDEEEEKKNFYIIRTDANPEAAREQRYREILAGETSESKFDPAAGKTRKSAGTSSLKASSRLTPSSGKGTPPKLTRKAMKDLGEAINKIPKVEQEEFKRKLKGMLQGKK